MDTNFQLVAKTFQAQHCPLQQLKRSCVFTELFESKDGRVVKKRTFQTKGEWLTWKKQVVEEMLIQRQLAQYYPDKFLQIIDYSVETYNHKRFLYITYDCDQSAQSLFKYLHENQVNYQEQIKIVEQILQILCLLQKFNCHHANLKLGNLIYYKNKVLLTDFGSARTHYSNFTKQYSGQKEKEWQNNFLFFQTREYLEIMQEENIDFHDEMWKKINTEDGKILTKADKWAIGVMILQVFENSQILPHQIDQFYGLNREKLIKKLSNLEQNKNVITKIVIEELLIKDHDAFTVYQSFQNHKKFIDINKCPQQLDETHSIQEVFDQKETHQFQLERNLNSDYYYMEKKKIQAMQTQYDKDDASSVASVQRPIIETIDYNVQNSDNLQQVQKKPDQLFVSQQIPKFPPRQDAFTKQNAEQILYQDDGQGFKRPGLQKPSIIVSQFQESKNIGQYHVTEQDDDENTRLINGNPISQSFKIVGYEPQQQSSQLAINDQQESFQALRLEKEKQTQKLEFFSSNQNQMGQFQDPFNTNIVNTGRFDTNGPQIFDMQKGQNLQEVKIAEAQNPSNGLQQKTGQFGFQQNNNFNLLEIEDLDDFQKNASPKNKVNEFIPEKQIESNVINLQNIVDPESKKLKFAQDSQIQFQNYDDSEKDKPNIQNFYPIDDQEDGLQKLPQNQSACFPNNTANLKPVNDNDQVQINKPQIHEQQMAQNFSLNPQQQFNEMKDPDFLASKQSVWSVEQNVNPIQQQSQLVVIKDKPQDQVGTQIQNLLPEEQIIKQDEKKQLNQVQDLSENKEQTQPSQINSVIDAEFVRSGRIQEVKDSDQKQVIGQKLESMPIKLNGKNLPKLEPIEDKKPSGQELYVNREMREIINKLINPQNLREISEEGLAKEQEKQQQLKNDIKEHLQNDEIIQFNDGEMKPTSRIINQNPEQLSKLQPSQVVQLEQQVDDYLKEIKKKDQANKLIKQDNIIQNPELLNMLSNQQLNKLAEKLNKQQDQQSQNLLKQVQKIQQVQKQLQQFIEQPKTKNLLSNDQIPLLNQQDLKKYYDQVRKLKEQTKQEQQRNRISDQLKIIEQQLQINQIDKRIQQFIDHPTVENLLPEDMLKLLTPEQRQKYQKALEDQLSRASRLLKKEIEKQLDILKNQIDKSKNKIYITPKEIPKGKQDDQFDDKFDPTKYQNSAPGDIFQAKFDQIKDACAKDGVLLSLNKYIRSFQLYHQLYQLNEQIPQDCSEHIQEKQKTIITDNFNNDRYQGYWSHGVPHGFGVLREGKHSAIYRGIFKKGKFYWGQAIEINESGQLTQYIGYYHYHNQLKVKHGLSKMTWFKPQIKIGWCKYHYTFDELETYEGQFIFGRIYGKGKKIYSNGSYYEGEWKNNLRDGKGKLVQTINNRQVIYYGNFQNDQLQGEFKYIYDEKRNLYEIGQYEKGKPIGIHNLYLGDQKQTTIQY